MKFKAGDRVRIVDSYSPNRYKNGDIGRITERATLRVDVRWANINGEEALIQESEMELVDMNLLKDLTATIEVKPGQPETTKAIIRLLVALGCSDPYVYVTSDTVTSAAGFIYIQHGRIDGWDRNSNTRNCTNCLVTTRPKPPPKPKAKIVAPDGTEIELSDETWESMRESLK